jgi:hypothetical protein
MEEYQKEVALIMQKAGKSIRQISAATGVPKSSVHDFLKDKYKGLTKWEKEEERCKRDFSRVLVISDTHCGSKVGLTPPDWMFNVQGGSKEERKKIASMQEEMWDFFSTGVSSLGHIDALFHIGDAIDGKASKDGGNGLITSSLNEQVDIAVQVFDSIPCKNIFLVGGTGYHTYAGGEDFEEVLAKEIGAIFDGRLWVDINGILFDLRHAIGSSGIPHGRATQLSKEYVWNRLWEEKKMQPKSDVILRGHVHYHIANSTTKYMAMSCPSLQGPKTIFGERKCSGTVDFGFLVFDILHEAQDLNDISYSVHTKDLLTFSPDIYFCR